MASIAAILRLLPLILVEYQEVKLINELNNFFNFDHNIFLVDSTVDMNRFLRRQEVVPRSLYAFKSVDDGSTGYTNVTDIQSKNTLMVVVPGSPRFDDNLNWLNGILEIQSYYNNIKFGIFLPYFSSSGNIQRFFEWCKEKVIINIFVATYLQPEVNQGATTIHLLNIFTLHPFKTLEVKNVTICETYDSYFPSLDSNFHQHQLKLGETPFRYEVYANMWLTAFRLMNASYLLPSKLYNTSESELIKDGIDVVPNLETMTKTTRYDVYPMQYQSYTILTPLALPYEGFTAYLQSLTSNWFFFYSIITIAGVILLLSVMRYLRQRKFVFLESVANVVNLLLNDNSYINYGGLFREEVFIIVPLTFTGLVFVNGILSNLQSYLTQPVYQPQIKTLDDIYSSPYPILISHDKTMMKILEFINVTRYTKYEHWSEKFILWEWSKFFEHAITFNTSTSVATSIQTTRLLLDVQQIMNVRGFYNTRKPLTYDLMAYRIFPKFRFIDRLNDIFLRIHSSGLFDRWDLSSVRVITISRLVKMNVERLSNQDNVEKKFEFPTLIAYGWLASIIVFIIEIIWKHWLHCGRKGRSKMNNNTEIESGQFNAYVSRIMFTDLRYDCLVSTFRYLNLSDLGRVSDVCQLFKDLTIETFKLEWKAQTIRLCNDSKKNRLGASTILRRFGNMLHKIEIAFGEQNNDIFFNIIIEKCSPNLMEVAFSSTRLCNHLEKILNQTNIDRFVNEFQNLKSLRFNANSDQLTDPQCIEQQFSALEHLRLFGYPFDIRNVKNFVNLNPQTKSLFLPYCNDIQKLRSLLELMDEKLPNLDQLGLWLHENTNEINYQPQYLKNLKQLKIRNNGPTNNMNHLSISNESVEEMEFEVATCDEQLVAFIGQYKELKKLAIKTCMDSPFDCKLLQTLGQHLPKLAEIGVNSFCKNLNHADIVNFVNGSTQLVAFVMRDIRRENISKDAKEFEMKLHPAVWKVACDPSSDEIRIFKCIKSEMRRKSQIISESNVIVISEIEVHNPCEMPRLMSSANSDSQKARKMDNTRSKIV